MPGVSRLALEDAALDRDLRSRAGETDIYAVQDDITDRVVSTVADKTGVPARSMVQAIRGSRWNS
jgi:hypothetical protein